MTAASSPPAAARPMQGLADWKFRRPTDGVIVVSKWRLGGYAARRDDSNIASSILFELASEVEAVQAQPASAALVQPSAALTDDQCQALRQTLDFLREQEGKSHQGYFYSGWAGRQLRAAMLSSAAPSDTSGAAKNAYRCGHCGYEGPCYSNGFSAPWCKQCQRNDALTAIAAAPQSMHVEGDVHTKAGKAEHVDGVSWCHKASHGEPRCATQCAECADLSGVQPLADAGVQKDGHG